MRLRALVGWSVGLGLGVGLALGVGTTYLNGPPAELSNEVIKQRARALGMRPMTELAGAEVTLSVGPGTTPEQLADALQQVGLVVDRVGLLAQAAGKRPQAGVYHLRPEQSLTALIAELFR